MDFLDLGSRDAVDKALQRLVSGGRLRRLDRGLYDTPRINRLTKRPALADYRHIVDALARRDQVRMLVDGLTAANDLGLTTAVPSKVVIHTDARKRAIQLDNLTIQFKRTAPSKLYWAGRPAMRIVQALPWLKDTLPTDRDRILARLSSILADPRYGNGLRDDLRAGLPTLPAWMQDLVRELLSRDHDHPIPPNRGRRDRARARPTPRRIVASRASRTRRSTPASRERRRAPRRVPNDGSSIRHSQAPLLKGASTERRAASREDRFPPGIPSTRSVVHRRGDDFRAETLYEPFPRAQQGDESQFLHFADEQELP